jgi:hypothetical protein
MLKPFLDGWVCVGYCVELSLQLLHKVPEKQQIFTQPILFTQSCLYKITPVPYAITDEEKKYFPIRLPQYIVQYCKCTQTTEIALLVAYDICTVVACMVAYINGGIYVYAANHVKPWAGLILRPQAWINLHRSATTVIS